MRGVIFLEINVIICIFPPFKSIEGNLQEDLSFCHKLKFRLFFTNIGNLEHNYVKKLIFRIQNFFVVNFG